MLLIVVLKYSQNIARYFYPIEIPHLQPMPNLIASLFYSIITVPQYSSSHVNSIIKF